MNFSELLAEVYLITNRPDRVNETKSAIKAATLKMHQTDFYSKDIFEQGISWPSADFRQSLDYISLISNWRALKYIRRVENGTDDDTTNFFQIITPEEVVNSYGKMRKDVAYVAGRVMEIRSAVSFQYALLGCYVNPIVREEAYSSWVAEMYPYTIIHEAARMIFKLTGQLDEAAGQREFVAECLTTMKNSCLTDVGY
jgi:hypothetical protein